MSLQLTNISKKFNQTTQVLCQLNLNIKQGEIIAILGSSGSGKSTLLNVIAGFEEPETGSVIVNGNTLFSKDAGICIAPEKRNIGYVFQNYALFPHMNVYHNIAFGLDKNHFKSATNKQTRIKELLLLVGLSGFEKSYPHQLSGGQQQRIALARALAPSPSILLLDEPFSGLDTELRLKTRGEVRKIIKQAQTTAILVTHDQEEAFSIADRVAIMDQGVIEQIAKPEQIYHFPTSRFVANFLGQANFIDGEITKRGISTEIGVLPNTTRLTKDTKVVVMIRPEGIAFKLDEKGSATVVSRSFKGYENLYVLALPSGKLIQSSQSSNTIIQPKDKVTIDASHDHIVIF